MMTINNEYRMATLFTHLDVEVNSFINVLVRVNAVDKND